MTRRRNTADAPGRRASDSKGVRAKIVYFWQVWGRDCWLVLTTIVAMWAAITGYRASADANDANTALERTAVKASEQAREACERSLKLSPPFIKLMKDAQGRGIVTDDEVKLYEAIVPKEC